MVVFVWGFGYVNVVWGIVDGFAEGYDRIGDANFGIIYEIFLEIF